GRKRKANGWALYEVAFSIPATWSSPKEDLGVVLVSPFIYTEADVDAIIDRELNGRPTVDATLEEPGIGLVEEDDTVEYPLMTLSTEVLLKNQKAEERLLLAIYQGDALKSPRYDPEKAEWEAKLGRYKPGLAPRDVFCRAIWREGGTPI